MNTIGFVAVIGFISTAATKEQLEQLDEAIDSRRRALEQAAASKMTQEKRPALVHRGDIRSFSGAGFLKM